MTCDVWLTKHPHLQPDRRRARTRRGRRAEVLTLIRTLASSSLPGTFAQQCRNLKAEIDSIGARDQLPLTHSWRYRRTGCPFCDVQDEHRLAVVVVEGEAGLRIDYCERCDGCLKTYDGEGSESVLLSDWTSLHLDINARERGLKRMAASLYHPGA